MSDNLDKQIDKALEKKAKENLERLIEEQVSKHLAINKHLLKEDALGRRRKELKIAIPLLNMNENFGKEGTIEREELTRIVNQATHGASGPFEKMRMIQVQMEQLRAGIMIKKGEKVQNPSKWISQIMILETFNRMFKSFQSSPAGFVNEGFISVFYDSTQIDAGTGNSENNIGDLTHDGIPVSLKTKVKPFNVEGSTYNLVASINKFKKVYFDIFAKTGTPEGGVGKLQIYRFTIDQSNLNEFLRADPKNPFFVLKGKDLVPAKGWILKPPPDKSKEEELQEAKPPKRPISPEELAGVSKQKSKTEMVKKLSNMLIDNIRDFVEIDTGRVQVSDEELISRIEEDILEAVKSAHNQGISVSGILSDVKAVMVKYLEDYQQKLTSGTISNRKGEKIYGSQKHMFEKLPIIRGAIGKSIQAAIDNLGEPPTSLAKVHEKGIIPGEFHSSQNFWMKFVDREAFAPVTLSFSDEEIQQSVAALTESMHGYMIDLVNNIELLASTFNKFLTSDTSTRNSLGQKAIAISKEIQPATEEAISGMGGDE